LTTEDSYTGSISQQRLSDQVSTITRNVIALGLVSLCMAMSSAMIHGLMPAFLVTVLGVSVLSVGAIEGIAEATTSFVKIFSGRLSDGLGRRKVLVVLGYALSATAKLLFPLAETASSILAARTTDRIGKGIRDAPRDALLADVTPSEIRGSGHGLRTALYTVGAVAGPLTAIGLMTQTGDNYRLVFSLAVIPGFLSIAVLVIGVEEVSDWPAGLERRIIMRRSDLQLLTPVFWWAVSIAAILALARCSQAFLLLKAGSIGIDPAFLCSDNSCLDEPRFFCERLSLRYVSGSPQPEAAAWYRGGSSDRCRSRTCLCTNDLVDRHRSRVVGSADGPHSRFALGGCRRRVTASDTGRGIRDL
jgi:MFS family permease